MNSRLQVRYQLPCLVSTSSCSAPKENYCEPRRTPRLCKPVGRNLLILVVLDPVRRISLTNQDPCDDPCRGIRDAASELLISPTCIGRSGSQGNVRLRIVIHTSLLPTTSA